MRSNEEMAAAVKEAVDLARRKKKRRVKALAVALAAALLFGIPGSVYARRRALTMPQIMDDLRQKALTVVDDGEVEAVRAEIAASDGLFSRPNDPPDTEVLLDESQATPVGSRDCSGDYEFCLERLVPGKTVRWRVVGGSIANGDADLKRVVENDVYAIVSLKRLDGGVLTEREERLDFMMNYLIEGYEPESTTACFLGEPVLRRIDGNTVYYAVAVTNMLIFARHGFALAILENLITEDLEDMTENSMGHVSRENFYADKNGNFAFKGWALDRLHALLPFTADESYADEAAEKAYVKTHCINRNFRGYTK